MQLGLFCCQQLLILCLYTCSIRILQPLLSMLQQSPIANRYAMFLFSLMSPLDHVNRESNFLSLTKHQARQEMILSGQSSDYFNIIPACSNIRIGRQGSIFLLRE